MAIPWSHEGRIARLNNKTIKENPYNSQMSSYRDWEAGWKQADEGETKYCPHCGQEVKYG